MRSLLDRPARPRLVVLPGSGQGGLRQGVLTPMEILAQSIAGLGPSATPGLLIPIVFGTAGNGTWLVYVLATLGMLFTAQCINEFASRSACPGSLYTFVGQGLGRHFGMLTGWALLFAYVVCGAACIAEFTIYALSVLKHFLHIETSAQTMMLLCTLLVGYIAYKNIKLSAVLMLWLELISVGLILLVTALVLGQHGLHVDIDQLCLSQVRFENVRMGLVMAIFSFAAFESAASLGAEAMNPLKSVPRAISSSVLCSGIFFVLTSYAMVLGFRGAALGLEKCSTPLPSMAAQVGIPSLGHLIDIGIMMSFFAAGIACLNAAARIIYKMSDDGLFPRVFGDTHAHNRTPHIAVVMSSCLSLSISVVLVALNCPLLDIVGWLGTLATFGFIFAYMATSISAAKYLHTIKESSPAKIFIVVASTFVLTLSLIGSIYPAPPFPYNVLPCIFSIYMCFAFLTSGKMIKAESSQAESLIER